MSDPRCKCTMSISMTGDGCRYCQPQEHIERMGEWLDEERDEITTLRTENEELQVMAETLTEALKEARHHVVISPDIVRGGFIQEIDDLIAAQQPINHDWDDQDKCNRCGDRDWYATSTCTSKQKADPDVSALVEALQNLVRLYYGEDRQQQPGQYAQAAVAALATYRNQGDTL